MVVEWSVMAIDIIKLSQELAYLSVVEVPVGSVDAELFFPASI